MYPYRPRRLRLNSTLRRMVRETRLSVDQFIYPLFVCPGKGVREPIAAMPRCYHISLDELAKEVKEATGLNIPAIILFGLPETKDDVASQAYAPDGIVQQAIKVAKDLAPDLQVITDVCLCQYTSHGHCGVVEAGKVVNDPSVELLVKTAVSHARAGADMVAPSDMMDLRIGAMREALDEEGFSDTPIMSYAAKYASAFYGPFREAAHSAPQFGDRRTYQMDPPNIREALKEVELDVEEGADIVMVKPALAYLDVIAAVKEMVDLPVAAYNVSGEYSMICAAAERGWLDYNQAMMETLTAITRAGADLLLTYFAKDAAKLLNG